MQGERRLASIKPTKIRQYNKEQRAKNMSKQRRPSEDKRLLVAETEFSSTLKVLKREGMTLSPVVRNAWDTGDLNTLVKNQPAKATGAHISIIGHITKQELLKHLEETEAANGFGNRLLWVYVDRSKILPEGGNLQDQDLVPIKKKVKAAVSFAQSAGRVKLR